METLLWPLQKSSTAGDKERPSPSVRGSSFIHINVVECFVSPFLASEEEIPRKGQVRFFCRTLWPQPCRWTFLLQTLVIPHAEWMRITASLTSTDKKVEDAKARADARKTMHEASKAMVKSWDNTIEVGTQGDVLARQHAIYYIFFGLHFRVSDKSVWKLARREKRRRKRRKSKLTSRKPSFRQISARRRSRRPVRWCTTRLTESKRFTWVIQAETHALGYW